MILEISTQTTYRVLCIIICAFVAMGAAQSAKVVYNSLKEKRLAPGAFWSTGGMPSSHSATMISLVTSLGILEAYYEHGIGYDFAIALAFASVVIYDAMVLSSVRHGLTVYRRLWIMRMIMACMSF